MDKNYKKIRDYLSRDDVSVKDKAKELLEYYYDTPDRDDKEFDTLDMCLDLLGELIKEA